jgi:hypothetical protein
MSTSEDQPPAPEMQPESSPRGDGDAPAQDTSDAIADGLFGGGASQAESAGEATEEQPEHESEAQQPEQAPSAREAAFAEQNAAPVGEDDDLLGALLSTGPSPEETEEQQQPTADDEQARAARDGEADAEETEEGDPAEEEAATEEQQREGDAGEASEEPARQVDDETLRALGEKTGGQYDSLDDVAERVNRLQTERDGFHELGALMEERPDVGRYIEARLEGSSPQEAAMAAADGLTSEAPDPDIDPEGYAEYKAEQARKEERSKHSEEAAQQRQKRQKQMRRQVQRDFQAFVDRHDMDDEEAQDFGETFSEVVQGDPKRGRTRSDMFDIVYRGLPDNYESAIEEAREEGRVEGRNEVLEEQRRNPNGRGQSAPGGGDSSGDGVPLLIGRGGEPQPQEGGHGAGQNGDLLSALFEPTN